MDSRRYGRSFSVPAIIVFVKREIIVRLRLHGWTFTRDCIVLAAAYVLALVARSDRFPSDSERGPLLVFLLVIFLVFCTVNYLFGIHRRLWQYAGAHDLRILVDATIISTCVVTDIDLLTTLTMRARLVPLSVVLMGGALSLMGLAAVRLFGRFVAAHGTTTVRSRALIVGAGHGGQMVASELLRDTESGLIPVCFLDDDRRKQRMRIHGVPVVGTIEQLPEKVHSHDIDVIAVAIPSASVEAIDRILDTAQKTDARIQVLPALTSVAAGREPPYLRDVNLNDLFQRFRNADPGPPVDSMFEGRTILVTGAAGSIGSEICRQLVKLPVKKMLALDNNETGLFYLGRELQEHIDSGKLEVVLTRIQDQPRVESVFRRHTPEIVFHAAAYKHVPMLESFPEEAVIVNVLGTLTMVRVAAKFGCERFVNISTDKAVDPVNMLGFSKRLGELIVRAFTGQAGTRFCSVRFGNVVGSRGSALPEFVRQIDQGGPVTVTHPQVERYFMTIPEAADLVVRAGTYATGKGELFLLDMGSPVKVDDVVRRIIRMRGLRVGKDIEIRYSGLRSGEKLTEELTFKAERLEGTPSPLIYQVRDELQPDLCEIQASVGLLVKAAYDGDTQYLQNMLKLAVARFSHADASIGV